MQYALIYDGVMLFAAAIAQLGESADTASIRCNDPDSIWKNGYTISNFMKNVRWNILNRIKAQLIIILSFFRHQLMV